MLPNISVSGAFTGNADTATLATNVVGGQIEFYLIIILIQQQHLLHFNI